MEIPEQFKAMVVEEVADKKFVRRIGTRSIDELPDGEVLIRVKYSSLNYKDALSATGNKGVTRQFPHTPGIDAAGEVAASATDRLRAGAPVVVTGYDLGMNTPGGFAEYIRVPADWVVRLPDGLSLRESMILGTAGFTAGLSVWKLQECGVTPDRGEVLVTGATGGVGSVAVAVLAKIGFRVVAVSGKTDRKSFLDQLGATEVISREEATDTSGRPMLKGRWAGVVDTVGGDILASALKSLQYGGVATCCGLVASPSLSTTVFPFILRGVSLLGIDSVECPMDLRQAVWQKLAGQWKPADLEGLSSQVDLEALDPLIDQILAGKVTGRVVVTVG
ncbi:MAG: quinone oxidoreductase [Deltaproteobacteria bacterium SG8_13]|nr:MAG: quinone oxidoreductase [Deltaproteobacteria bacterium SG8_13]